MKFASVISASGMVWPLENEPTTRFWLSTETDCSEPGGIAVLLQLVDLRRAAGIGELRQAVGAEIDLDVAERVAVDGQVGSVSVLVVGGINWPLELKMKSVPTFCQADCVPVALELV